MELRRTMSKFLWLPVTIFCFFSCWSDDSDKNQETLNQIIFFQLVGPNVESGVCPSVSEVPEIVPGGFSKSITATETFFFTFPLINRNNYSDASIKYQIDFAENVGQDIRPYVVNCLAPTSSAFTKFQGESGFSGQSETITASIINRVPASGGVGRSIILFRGISGSGTINIQVPSSAL